MSGQDKNLKPLVRVAVVAAGPVFYQVPLYRRIAADPRIQLDVFYSSSAGVRAYDAGFGSRPIVWDVDLLDGYEAIFLRGAETNPTRGGFFTLRDWDLFGRIFRGRYDVVWLSGYSYLTMWIGLLAGLLARSQVFIRDDQTLLHPRPRPRSWIRAAVLRAVFSLVGGFYVGQNNRDFFLHYGVREDRLRFVPHAVEGERLTADAPTKGEALGRFGLSKGVPVVLFVGKLVSKKAPELLLRALRTVQANHPCQLLIVGEGPLDGALKAFVTANRIPGVHFAGFLNRSEIASAYAAADVLVLPSELNETWGLVLNEAMHFALPIIASDKVGAARDLLSDGQNGFVFPSGDVEHLAEALGASLSDPERTRELGLESRRMVEAWSFDAAASAVLETCLQAACRSRANSRDKLEIPWSA